MLLLFRFHLNVFVYKDYVDILMDRSTDAVAVFSLLLDYVCGKCVFVTDAFSSVRHTPKHTRTRAYTHTDTT